MGVSRRRRRAEEERDHWIGWNDWIEDMGSDKSAIVAGVGAGAGVTAGSDLHDWSGRRTLSVAHYAHSRYAHYAHSYFLGHGMPWLADPNTVRCGGTT